VTNVGPTHLEFLGTVEAVAHEKLQAMKYAERDATLIVNADDQVLMAEARRVHDRPITFAVSGKADYRPDSIRQVDGATAVTIEAHRFRLPLFGQYQVYNLLAAYAISRTVGCRFEGIDTESIELSAASMRGDTIRAGEITFISDCYNANPEAVKAGLISLVQIPSVGRRVVILGDMLELGEDSPAYHQEIGLALGAHRFDLIIAIGPLSTKLVQGATKAGIPAERLCHYRDARACAEAIKDLLKPGDLVYLKGSRGVGLEIILEQFSLEGGTS
jgi:UDP-N-acetylmuramoyl-tripeptide--D-alanyl-D-alanine ligase